MKRYNLFTITLILLVPLIVNAQKTYNYNTNSRIIYDICFTNKGEALGIADNNTIKVYFTDSKELIHEFKNGHTGQILTIDISKDSTLLVSGGKDSTIVIWDLIKGNILQSLRFQKGVVTSVKISPDSKYLVSGCSDKKVYLFDIKKNKTIYEFTSHKDDITSVTFSPDGNLIVTASGDKKINIYKVENGEIIASIKAHSNWVREVLFSNDGSKLISCGDDSKLITWDISDINNIRKIESSRLLFSGWLLSVDFSRNSDANVSGSSNGKLRIGTSLINYKAKVGVPITKVLFKSNESLFLIVAVATIGKGVFLVDSRNM